MKYAVAKILARFHESSAQMIALVLLVPSRLILRGI